MGNTKSRIPGICKGKVKMSDDFDEPLTFETWDKIKKKILSCPDTKKEMASVLKKAVKEEYEI